MAAPTARSAGFKLLVFGCGSRGDCQPIIALCSSLAKAGFVVRLSINVNHVEFARSMGVDAVDGQSNSEQCMREHPKLRECMAKGDNAAFAAALGELSRELFPGVLAKKIDNFKAFRPDAIISTPLEGFEGCALAGAAGIPHIMANLQLTNPSRECVSFLAEPRWAPHRIFGTIFSHLFWQSEHGNKVLPIREHIPEGEPFLPSSFRQFMFLAHHPVAPVVCGFSPSLKHIPADYSDDLKARVHITGFWTITKDEQEEKLMEGNNMFGGPERSALESFLARGAPPVYMGWGSMVSVSAEHMTLLAVRALARAGMRGIVLGGYAGLEPGLLAGQSDSERLKAYAADHILFVHTAPHEWLFPRCSVTVHHGGAGTMAAAFRSGVPTVITPCAFDQFDHANLAADNGVGVGMRHLSKVTVAELAAAVKRCAVDESMQERCRALAGKLQSEDGLGSAVRVIDDFIADEVKTGKWRVNFEVQTRGLKTLQSRPPPGCLAWIGRMCCSATPNDYSVKMPDGVVRTLPRLIGARQAVAAQKILPAKA